MRPLHVATAVAVVASSALAEEADFNLHLEPGIGVGLNASRPYLSGVALKVDSTWLGIGPLTPQLQLFGLGSSQNTYLAAGSALGGGIGLRVRLLNDTSGYWYDASGHTGSLWGNLWLDASFDATNAGAGFDVGIGGELSLLDGLQLGPFAKFYSLGSSRLLLFGLSLSLEIQGAPKDPDGDLVTDAADKCPNEAEDKDGFEDSDGCPEADNDKDGIPDSTDAAPNEAEDKDGFQDGDGKPEPDNDGDGIPDVVDAAPNDAEDKDGFEDTDGRPELDNDHDGIVDAEDAAPNEAEDKDGFEDSDGKPDPDNDRDGIADSADRCPTDPETIDGIDDTDGCPEKSAKVFVAGNRIVILEKIYFAAGKSDILPKSTKVVDGVAKILKQFPNIKAIRVEGHTDDVGDDAKNLALSSARAAAVVAALGKRGVEPARLQAAGYGESRPVVADTTAQAREQNRRVDFVILDEKAQ